MRRGTKVLLSLVVSLGFAAVGFAANGKVVEAPTRVQTEGTTYVEYRAHQADLMARLGPSSSAASQNAAIRVEISKQESDAIERAPRVNGAPQQIGQVKTVAPRLVVDGLQLGADDGSPRRGPRGRAISSPDSGYVWAVAVTSAGAGALRVHLENLSLPPSAALYFYSRSGEAFGPYLGAGPDGDGDLWTDTVFGMEGILQLHVASAADLARVSLSVTEVGVVMPRFAGVFTPEAAPICGDPVCIVDATCISNTPANQAKLAVAKMEWAQGQFMYTCTGGLIQGLGSAQSNLFLTAAHCLGNNKTAKNLQFYWRFAASACDGNCPSNTGWPYKTMGSTVVTTAKKGDFTLLHLDANPPAGSVHLGWTNSAVAFTNGAQLYRVSNPDFGAQVYSQHDIDASFPPCGGWPRGNWMYSRDITGAIDGGSSGSPILNAFAQIVGQLSGTCGGNPSDACSSGPGEANTTVDGALAGYYSAIQPYINP